MPAYARGSKALGICDRSGRTYKLSDQPQNFLGRVKINDPQALQNPRPDYAPGNGLFGWNPVWNPIQDMVGSVGTVTVVTTAGE